MDQAVDDELGRAREVHRACEAHLKGATAAASAARYTLERLERADLDAAGASGDLDRCLRAVAATQTPAWSKSCEDVIRTYLRQAAGPLTEGWQRTSGGACLVPSLADPSPDVPPGAGDALLAVLDRFSQVFDYPDEMLLEAGDGAPTLYLTLTRSTGHATLEKFSDYRQEMVTLASGHLRDVLQTDPWAS